MIPKSQSSIVDCLRDALSNYDQDSIGNDDINHIKIIVDKLCSVAFSNNPESRDKIEALKLITETLRHDLLEGMAITQMEELIIDRSCVGYPWAREVEPNLEIRGRSRVACLYENNVYLIGKVVQFKHTPETHIIENQLTGELYEWQLSEVRHLSISECIAWINHINTTRQPDGFVLPKGHVDQLRAQHSV